MINIIIVCWNAVNYTKVTLCSLINSLKKINDFRLTIIDNGSNDKTNDFLNEFVSTNNEHEIKLIKNKKNMGIGFAYNQGLNESIKTGSDYTVFCNNDLFFVNE